MEKYDHKKIEKKWQDKWCKDKAYEAEANSLKKKFYFLVEFPYPSGDGLHVGHVRSYTALDCLARKRRAEGENVLYPIGWDAFGLPTENYAIKTGIHPRIVTKENTDTFRKQLQSIGFSFDWSREINTTDPEYYKWTQWIFLKLFEKGLAYKACMPINWCLECKIGLANEEVVDEVCERCGGDIDVREKEQWMLAITKYADRLDADLDTVDYWERIKTQQRNWIGKSDGHELDFNIKDSEEKMRVFTTRPDTLYGATYMVLAPEHFLLERLKDQMTNWSEVEKYKQASKQKTDIERTAEGKEKTGVELQGIKAINPANNEEIPVYVADYVLVHYGTGAIMAVPAHDERDFAFAKKFSISITEVITGGEELPYIGVGTLINSGEFDGKYNINAGKEIAMKVGGELKTTYKLRDWLFSRQRYWGEPIPMIHCEKCDWVPVPEEELPLELPIVENYKPTDTGDSPLAAIDEWVNTTCPKCSGAGKRETDVMPNWAGSSWYYLRYVDPKNSEALASKENLKEWTPVDWYNGGMEHTTLHLLYSRFWHKFLYDIGVVPTEEPYAKRTSHGLILAEGGEKMSKSKGNVVNPDEVVEKVGADTLRIYEMFIGPFDQPIAWSTDNMVGSRRFLEKVWNLQEKISEVDLQKETEVLLHQTIEKIGSDIETLKFNTAVSQLMIFVNELEKCESIPRSTYKILLQLLAPLAPHISEELWERIGETDLIHTATWPVYDKEKARKEESTIVVQVNGKVRGQFNAATDLEEEALKKMAFSLPVIKKHLESKKILRCIIVPNKLINIVIQ